MNIPNVITLLRLVTVPVIIWLILQGQMAYAFGLFLLAGISDAIDGPLARRSGQVSELGTILDPIADKALLVSIYITVGIEGGMPSWIVITVVSRDVLIIGGILLSYLLNRPVEIKPSRVSKINTASQIALAAMVLFNLGFGDTLELIDPWFIEAMIILVAVTTIMSGILYAVTWIRAVTAHGEQA
ncbi:MAG TPA: CDP-alcohol phosphatidyltransferase family protein [Alphaproteobacteria bacterium]|nr:CDP-alcohol phosphatidyltransferase family protein [Alphaproteobacteria bacterium]